MWVQYQSDGEQIGVMTLADLIANFDANGGWQHRHNETDMRAELEARGWYEGEHDFGRYLVLNLKKLGLQGGH
jgi:hypothetical protein